MDKVTEQKARKTRNEYFRQYRAAHKDKMSEYQKRYWAKRGEREEDSKSAAQ